MAISRIEQLSPLDYESIIASLDKYPNADLMFAQEEPLNNGGWPYLAPRLRMTCNQTEHHKGKEFLVSSRPPSCSVATSWHTVAPFGVLQSESSISCERDHCRSTPSLWKMIFPSDKIV